MGRRPQVQCTKSLREFYVNATSYYCLKCYISEDEKTLKIYKNAQTIKMLLNSTDLGTVQ